MTQTCCGCPSWKQLGMACIKRPGGTCDCHSATVTRKRNGDWKIRRTPTLPKRKPSQKSDSIRRRILTGGKHTILGGEQDG